MTVPTHVGERHGNGIAIFQPSGVSEDETFKTNDLQLIPGINLKPVNQSTAL